MAGGQEDRWVETEHIGSAGIVRLNRPGALNALTTSMLSHMHEILTTWSRDPQVKIVVLQGVGERGLCAGGDLRAMRQSAIASDGQAREFFRTEYRLNAQIAKYEKPYVAIMHGITMGGGIGISAHGSTRIVTESSVLAMPEVAIGLVPDVGGTWLLSRSPGELGTYVALTGLQFGPEDAIALGLADHFVPDARVASLVAELAASGSTACLGDFASPIETESDLTRNRPWIDACFARETVEEILSNLRANSAVEARAAADVIETRSPHALKVTLAALRRSRNLKTLDEALEQEFIVSCACLEHPDLVEGIRSVILDKDGQPTWQASSLQQVSQASVEDFFADRGYGSVGLIPSQG